MQWCSKKLFLLIIKLSYKNPKYFSLQIIDLPAKHVYNQPFMHLSTQSTAKQQKSPQKNKIGRTHRLVSRILPKFGRFSGRRVGPASGPVNRPVRPNFSQFGPNFGHRRPNSPFRRPDRELRGAEEEERKVFCRWVVDKG